MSKNKRKPLTARQQEILGFIKSCITEKYPPSIREIGEHFGFSEKAAFDHLKVLEKKGYLERVPDAARAIRIIDAPSDSNSDHLPDELTLEITPKIEVQVSGFSIGEFVRLRRQTEGEPGDFVLIDLYGKLVLRRLLGSYQKGLIGKVIGKYTAIG